MLFLHTLLIQSQRSSSRLTSFAFSSKVPEGPSRLQTTSNRPRSERTSCWLVLLCRLVGLLQYLLRPGIRSFVYELISGLSPIQLPSRYTHWWLENSSIASTPTNLSAAQLPHHQLPSRFSTTLQHLSKWAMLPRDITPLQYSRNQRSHTME